MSNHAQGWSAINKKSFSLHPMLIVLIGLASLAFLILVGQYVGDMALWVLARKSIPLTIVMVSIASIGILRLFLNMSWSMTIAIGTILSVGAIAVSV